MSLPVALALIASPIGAQTQNDMLKQGIREFNAGDFGDAAGHLYAAMPTDYNNAVLHYYLANAYIKLNQRETAIREYRIAYALQPDGDVGRLSKTALDSMGALPSEGKDKQALLQDLVQKYSKPAWTETKSERNFDFGRQLFGRGDYINAISAFQMAERADPRNGSAYYYEALCLERSGSLAQAMEKYKVVKGSFPTATYGHIAALKLMPNSDPALIRELEKNYLAQTAIGAPPGSAVGSTVDVPFTRQGKYLVLNGSVGKYACKLYYDPYVTRVIFPATWAQAGMKSAADIVDQGSMINLPEFGNRLARSVVAHEVQIGSVMKKDVGAFVPLNTMDLPTGPVIGKSFFGSEPQVDGEHYLLKCPR